MLPTSLRAVAAQVAPLLPRSSRGRFWAQNKQLALRGRRYVVTTATVNDTKSVEAKEAQVATGKAEEVADETQKAAAAAAATATPSRDPRSYRPMDEALPTYLNPAHFHMLVRGHGTTFFAGVPDSLLKDICGYVTDHVSSEDHVIAANEGTALGLAAGHHLATGHVPCVYLQNSGLGNVVNPLLSLCSSKVYSIPVLLLIGWRGEPGRKDEPQHLLQGEVTPSLLHEMSIPFEILPDYADGAFEVLQKAYTYFKTESAPFALLVKKNTFEKYRLQKRFQLFGSDGMLHREEILEKILDCFPQDPVVTTTGFTSREMFELRVARGETHSLDFLTVGSMGHCSSIALGIALSQRQRQVLCVDGDGAAIMHMGSLVTAGLTAPGNFKHILINNAVHDSVGGQPTGATSIDFAEIARASGYRSAACVAAEESIGPALQTLREQEGPCFLEIKALPGARADLGRPTTSTHQNKSDFMTMLGSVGS